MSTPEFKYEKVSDRVTRIFAFTSELMYLVEGDERAALLDTGSGIGFVRPTVEKLTDLPVTVLVTHGHVDHAMGASEWDPKDVYINQEDKYIYDEHKSHEWRADGLFMMEERDQVVPEEDFTPIVEIEEYNDLKDGDVFDLGGVHVEMYACPGHTKGSLLMLIPEERMLLTGDDCNGFTFIFEDYAVSAETYRESLINVRERLAGKFDTVLASHGDGILVPEIIDEAIAVTDRIIARTDDAEPMEFRGNKGLIAVIGAEPHHANIVYNPDRITKDQEPWN